MALTETSLFSSNLSVAREAVRNDLGVIEERLLPDDIGHIWKLGSSQLGIELIDRRPKTFIRSIANSEIGEGLGEHQLTGAAVIDPVENLHDGHVERAERRAPRRNGHYEKPVDLTHRCGNDYRIEKGGKILEFLIEPADPSKYVGPLEIVQRTKQIRERAGHRHLIVGQLLGSGEVIDRIPPLGAKPNRERDEANRHGHDQKSDDGNTATRASTGRERGIRHVRGRGGT